MQISGPKLVLYFGWPCAEKKKDDGEISPEDFELLRAHVERNTRPETSLLRRCFPNLVAGLRQYSKGKGVGMWASGTVLKFLLHHHGHEGICAGRVGEIISISDKLVFVSIGGEIIRHFNFYGLMLGVGDKVLTHRLYVVTGLNRPLSVTAR